jgi:hypothetical protein
VITSSETSTWRTLASDGAAVLMPRLEDPHQRHRRQPELRFAPVAERAHARVQHSRSCRRRTSTDRQFRERAAWGRTLAPERWRHSSGRHLLVRELRNAGPLGGVLHGNGDDAALRVDVEPGLFVNACLRRCSGQPRAASRGGIVRPSGFDFGPDLWPSLRASSVFSFRSRVSTTGASLNSMCSVSVCAKY